MHRDLGCSECSSLEITASIPNDAPLFAVFLDCLYSVLNHDSPNRSNSPFPEYVRQTLRLLPDALADSVKQAVSNSLSLTEKFDSSYKAICHNDISHCPYRLLSTEVFEMKVSAFYEAACKYFSGKDVSVKDITQVANAFLDLEITPPKQISCDFYSYFRLAHEFIPAFVSAAVNSSACRIPEVNVTRTKRLERWGYFLDAECTLNVAFAAEKAGYGMKRGKIMVDSAQLPVGHFMQGGELYVSNDPCEVSLSDDQLREKLVAPSFKSGVIRVSRKAGRLTTFAIAS